MITSRVRLGKKISTVVAIIFVLFIIIAPKIIYSAQQSVSAKAVVIIGNSPTTGSTTPSGWPTCGYIAQGPYSGPTHNVSPNRPAVDVQDDNGTGDNVYSTHSGIIDNIFLNDPLGGNGILVRGDKYITLYAHLIGPAPGITIGQQVNAGTLIAFRDSTGNAILPHVHYMIWDTNYNEIPLDEFNSLVPPYSLYDTVPSTWGPCK